MADNIGVHWFRLDLRLSDNPSIENLSKNVASIMPIYIYDENQTIDVAMSSLETKTKGQKDSFLRQLMGNLGVPMGKSGPYIGSGKADD